MNCVASCARYGWGAPYWHRLAQDCQQRRQDVHHVYALIAANQAELPVRTLCKTLKVSTIGVYVWCQLPLSQRQETNATLTTQIRTAFIASDETYGMSRIRAELQDAGIVASRKRIARLTRLAQTQGCEQAA